MPEVDTHDPAGMARWLRERSDAAREFLALTDDQQRLQFLQRWQQNVLPHLAFRFEQAAQMIERFAEEDRQWDKHSLVEIIRERDRLRERERILLEAHTGCGCEPSCEICTEKGYT